MARNAYSNTEQLEGEYLRAMQEISHFLMKNLPASEFLWQALYEAEFKLKEAQEYRASLTETFGPGGVAAFCQSAVDSFKQNLSEISEDTAFVPALRDKRIRREGPRKHMSSSRSYRQARNATVTMAVLLVLIGLIAGGWYVGFWNYLFGGTSYYLKELHNFSGVVTPIEGTAMTFTLPLDQQHIQETVLYDDGAEYCVILNGLGTKTDEEHYRYTYPEEDENATPTKELFRPWYVRLVYTVDSSYSSVSYVEPSLIGAVATITYADGTTEVNDVNVLESGAYREGYEYIQLFFGLIPKNRDLTGAEVTLSLPGFQLVECQRVRTGILP